MRLPAASLPLAAQWAGTGYVALASMGLTVALARLMGPAEFGVYSFVFTAASLWGIVQDGGFKTLIFRETISGSSQLTQLGVGEHAIRSGAVFHVLAATLLGAFFCLAIPLPESLALLAGVLCFCALTLTNHVSSVLKGKGLFAQEAVWQILVRTANVLATLLVLALGWRAPFAVLLALAGGTLAALALPLARPLRLRPRLLKVKAVYASCVALAAVDAATFVYGRSDIIMLWAYGVADAEIGSYSAVYRMLTWLNLFLWPVAQIWFRHYRARLTTNPEREHSLLRAALWMALLGAGACTALLLFGETIVLTLFGEDFRDSTAFIQAIAFGLVFMAPGLILTQGAIAMNQEGPYARIAFLCAGANIGLNALVIPFFGALGAAWSTVATEALLCVLLLRLPGNRTFS